MTNRILYFAIFSISFLILKAQRIPHTPLINSFNANDYEGGIQNWQVDQGPNGFIYVANNYGLMEFDGETWHTYRVEDGTRSISLHITPSGRIYLGGQNEIGYFEENDIGLLEYNTLKGILPPGIKSLDNVWTILSSEGNILFNNLDYLFVYDQKENIRTVKLPSSAGFMFKALNRIFISIPGKGLYEWSGRELVLNPNFDVINKAIAAIIPFMRDQLLVFQTDGTVFKINGTSVTEWNIQFKETLKSSQVNDVIRLANNNIAIATQNSGLIVASMEGELLSHFAKDKGIPDNTLYSVLEDQFGNVWIGMNNAISCIELASPFSLVNESVGLPGTGYSAAYTDQTIYLGTNNGVFTPQGSEDSYEIIPGTEGQVYSIKEVAKKTLVGHHRGGFEIKDKTAVRIYDSTGLWSFTETYVPNKLLGGTYEGFITWNLNDDKIQDIAGFSESSRVFSFRNDSSLWMSHGFKGVYKLRFDEDLQYIEKVEFYGEEKGFPSNILINHFEVENDIIFPAETGVYSFNDNRNRFQKSKLLDEHFGDDKHVSVINTDSRGNIYFIEDHKLGRLLKDRFGRYKKETTQFNKVNKYLSDDLENISVLGPSSILIGAKNGFILYDPSKITRPPDTLRVYIRSLQVQHTQDSLITYGGLALTEKIKFEPTVKSLRLQFASPYFDGFEDLEYQYKLVGFDDRWSDWSTETTKEYTNLSYGKYSFEVRVKNIYNSVSQPASISFTLIPPWYLSNYAFAGYISLFLTFFGFAMYVLDRKHRKDKVRLTTEKDKEIQLKDNEFEQFEKASEKRISQLKNEKLKSEIDHKNRELTSTTMHIINKNEIMLGVKGKLQTLMKQDTIKNEELKKIIKTIDRNISEDDSWDHFTRHFDEVHGNFLQKLQDKYPNLTPQETKLAAYLRMNLNTKEIAQLLNISVRGVEISRYRLRKKLDIDRNTNLTSFMMNLE